VLASKALGIERARDNARLFMAPGVDCLDAFHDALLEAFPTLEASPLFHGPEANSSQNAVMRLNLMYSINAIFYYEHFTWALYYINVKIPPGSSAYATTGSGAKLISTVGAGAAESVQDLPRSILHYGPLAQFPGYSIAFHSPKPYWWFQAGYFDLNWYWHSVRQLLFPQDYALDFWIALVTRLMAWAVLYTLATRWMSRYFTQPFRDSMAEFWRLHGPAWLRPAKPMLPLGGTVSDEEMLFAGASSHSGPSSKWDADAVTTTGGPHRNSARVAQLQVKASTSSAMMVSYVPTISSTAGLSRDDMYRVDDEEDAGVHADRRCRAQVLGLMLGVFLVFFLSYFFTVPLIAPTTAPSVSGVLLCGCCTVSRTSALEPYAHCTLTQGH